MSFQPLVYALRLHVGLVRQRVEKQSGQVQEIPRGVCEVLINGITGKVGPGTIMRIVCQFLAKMRPKYDGLGTV
jgi:hypothetical protein